jgi:hypothetical protein
MKFNIRRLEESDYDELVNWWKDWKWEAPPRDFLPENGTGGFMVSNDDYKGKDRKEAIQFLINSLSAVAEESGAGYGYAVLKHKGLIEYYKNSGFSESDKNITEMVAIWQQQQQH